MGAEDTGEGKVQQVRIVYLNLGAHLESDVIRLQKGWKVRFARGANLLGRDVKVTTSISGEVPWSKDEDDLAARAEIVCERAGAFSYQFFVDGHERAAGSGYLQVLPQLEAAGKPLPLDAIVCQTSLAKLLGPLPEWEDRLRVAKETGYNMIHFTPVHALGISNSSYCIANHLELNPAFNTPDKQYNLEDVGALVAKMASEWGVLSIQDVVWNHAAKNSPWLMEHPECGYNCKNSPHLRPAYLVDRLLHHFSLEIAAGKYVEKGLPPLIETDAHLGALRSILKEDVFPRIRLSEFFKVNVENLTNEFRNIVTKGPSSDVLDEKLESSYGPDWKRFGFVVNMERARKIFNRTRGDAWEEGDRQQKCIDAFRYHLEFLNKEAETVALGIEDGAINAVIGHVSYERVLPYGPKIKELNERYPLVTCYFMHPFPSSSWEEDEHYAYDDNTSPRLLAYNGWVMNDDPMRNFAVYPAQVYLRRELVCWGDCVKLRYGDKPEDCPYLWNLMKEYSQSCARNFHGVRIDNCHSTPIHVAEYLLKAARDIRPDLYVVAELFTGRESLDNIFVNRLGITSLIREAQNAFDSHEQGRFVYRYGGDVVGAFIQRPVQDAVSCVAHALFYDQTHDNPSGIQKRSAYDLLPTAGMIAMASCANGSTRGYDEMFPFTVNVVHESRPYMKWSDLGKERGIIAAREVINKLHAWLAVNNYTQVFVDQMNFDIVAVTRHNPDTHDTVILVAHTAFKKDAICHGRPPVRDVYFRGSLDEIIFEASIEEKPEEEVIEEKGDLRGLKGYKVTLKEHLKPNESAMVTVHGIEDGHIELTNFSSGSVIAFRVSPLKSAIENINEIRKLLAGERLDLEKDLLGSLERMTLQTYNRVLFRCSEEEHDDWGSGSYHIPNYSSFVYCGIQGIMPVLKNIRLKNDLGHPMCGNLRDGMWLCDYIVNRLIRNKQTEEYGLVLRRMFEPLKELQHYLRPCYFEAILSHIFDVTRKELTKKLHPSLIKASGFVRALAVSSACFAGAVNSAKLAPLSPTIILEDSQPSSLAAGLPHFSVGIWRNWGRDTFIALPGCLLVTGRYHDAACLILSYGGALRHGLIPNLLAEGKGSRYNCRDAVWFWLHAIVKYIKMAPNGQDILRMKVLRVYPSDESEFGKEDKEEDLHVTMIEALNRHFVGIRFRERNAGPQIDEHMTDAGFNVSAYVDRETGFICGGNEWNCGTWMDKMGSSGKAGNRGVPATPRDGAAVELQGLAFAVVKELNDLHGKGVFPYPGVTDGVVTWSWSDWAEILKKNFESHFFVSDGETSPLVHRRGIVKDSFGSSGKYTDFQLRPNFAITLAVAPELMSPKNAQRAIDVAWDVLLGPMGIKTLDPKDLNYNGFYNNDDDSDVKKIAKGWNYHQGPEWLWVAAYFLRAKLVIAKQFNDSKIYDDAARSVRSRMGPYWDHIQRSPWRSLPELTNENGAFCPGSCPAQAWTIGCLLETMEELYRFH